METERTYTVTEAAKKMGRCVKTLQSWDRQGKLVSHRNLTNRRYYYESELRDALNMEKIPQSEKKIVAYCRVSSAAQKNDLASQRRALEEYCIAKGYANVEFVEEVGGGLNFSRKKFLTITEEIEREEISVLVVAHKDRFVRFGFDYFAQLAEKHRVKIDLLNSQSLSPEEEMVSDVMSILHCFSSRLYGLRNYKKTLKEALK